MNLETCTLIVERPYKKVYRCDDKISYLRQHIQSQIFLMRLLRQQE